MSQKKCHFLSEKKTDSFSLIHLRLFKKINKKNNFKDRDLRDN